MLKLSQFVNLLIIGNPAYGGAAKIYSATIDAVTGAISNWNGNDLVMSQNKSTVSGQFKAEKVWNAVWNDYADFQKLDDKLIYGLAYYDTQNGAKICNQRCQLSVMGIASDTFAHAVGQGANVGGELPIAVAGWVLAYVDKEYPCGTPLTNDEKGWLTEMTLQEKRDFPERLIAIYKKNESKEFFGTETSKIEVNGRHWVKVK